MARLTVENSTGNGDGDALADAHYSDSGPYNEPPKPAGPQPVTAAALVATGPELNPSIVDGVFRVGEIVNVISGSKSYKTYFLLAMLLSIANGRTWLGFTTRRVRVLLIDDELHPATLRHRLQAVAAALGINLDDVGDYLQIVTLRGQLSDIRRMGAFFKGIKAGYFGLVALDSWYRLIPPGVDENSNSEMTALYNLLDSYAAALDAAIVLIHHSTKGRQGDKQITDVGAGAGAMSRAADCHLILRAHADEGCAVLASALRSFAPMPALGLRWTYPTWALAADIDVEELQRDRPSRRTAVKTERPAKRVWTPADFVAAAVTDTPRPQKLIIAKAVGAGMSERNAATLLLLAEDARLIHRHAGKNGDNNAYFATTEPTLIEGVSRARTLPRTPCVRERTRGGRHASVREGDE
jgi:hypothetical protein